MFAPAVFGSRVFSLCKELLVIYHTFLEYSRIIWEPTQPTLILPDNSTVTRFFQRKSTPPILWNACDYVIHFKFRIMHIAGSQNTAANFLSQLELTPEEKVQLIMPEDILRAPIKVNLQ